MAESWTMSKSDSVIDRLRRVVEISRRRNGASEKNTYCRENSTGESMGGVSKLAKVVTRVKLGEEEENDFAYWQTQPPAARLAALEEIRREYHRWKYGGDPPMRKVVTIINRNGEVLRRWGDVEPVVD